MIFTCSQLLKGFCYHAILGRKNLQKKICFNLPTSSIISGRNGVICCGIKSVGKRLINIWSVKSELVNSFE